MIGDGFCNDETNIENCNYDGGDCCGYNINTDYCSDCKCYDNEACVAGTHPFVGDGFCNDDTNNANCSYDGGECCGSCVLKKQCTHCACLGGGDTMNVLIGNAVCNEEANIADCYYDGGDCCKSFEVLDLMHFMIPSTSAGGLIFILITYFNFEDCLRSVTIPPPLGI